MPSHTRISHSLCWSIAIACVIITIERLSGQQQQQQQQSSRGCGNCWSRNQKKEHDLQMFKDKILHKLRLSSPPIGPHFRREDLEKIPSIRSLIHECEQAQEDLYRPTDPPDSRTSRRCSGPHCGHVPRSGYDGMLMDDPNAYRSDEGGSGHDDEEEDEDEARTLVNVFQVPDPERSSGSTVRFSLENYSSNARDLEAAVLGVYLDETLIADTHTRSAFVYVYRNVRPEGWYGPITREYIRKKRVNLRSRSATSGLWIQFNITQFAHGWMQQPYTNLGLHLEAYDQGHPIQIISLMNTGQPDHRPYLQLQFRDPGEGLGQSPGGRQARSRRSHPQTNCNEMAQQSHCCRYSLVIDFKDFGWDSWIISPQKASVYYCSGECPFLYHTALGASHVGRQVTRQGSLPGEPCCSPTKFSDLKLLYISENGTYTQSELPNLIVDKCGCW